MFCLFSFSRWRWIYVCARSRSAGPAGENPHFIGTGMEKGSETLCHQFLLKSHLENSVIYAHYYYLFIIDFIYFFIIIIIVVFFCFFLYQMLYKLRACMSNLPLTFSPLPILLFVYS